LFRLNAVSRQPETMPEALKPYTYDIEGTFTVPPVDDLRAFRVIVVTCLSASILEGVGLPRGTFTHVFIDEAGQALEPEAFLPLSMATPETRVVLAGDPKQLGPVSTARCLRTSLSSRGELADVWHVLQLRGQIITSPVAAAFNYSTSLLERLMDLDVYGPKSPFRGQIYVKLVDNYRSHPAILKYPNEHFYDSELVPCAHSFVTDALLEWSAWPKPGFPVMFCAVRGRDQREGHSPSYFNTSELTVVKRYVNQLRKVEGLDEEDIGVISPYAAQVRKLRQVITSEDIMVGSTEQFQGQERR
jgi:helicase MOV-10